MCFCITEEMVADLLTKIVVGAQDHRLSLRFYSLIPESSRQVSGFAVGWIECQGLMELCGRF
jgi:hypothetical protein